MVEGARARARREITAAIKEEARGQLAASGPAALSLRAVARELNMVSSAVYRYFPSRDDLLTALIIDAYDEIGAAAEEALADTRGQRPASRWLAICRAVRGWALAHPQEYALVYGSPVPGYAAPQDTVAPASRVALALIEVLVQARRDDVLRPPHDELSPDLRADAERLAADLALELPPAVVVAVVQAWSGLFGLIGFELFGQFHRVVEAREDFFDHAVAALASRVGLIVS